MNIMYCNIGEMDQYNAQKGSAIEIHGGGSFNEHNIGHEVNNFTCCNGIYYGYARSTSESINITEHFECEKSAEFVDGILIVWVIKKKYIVGFYQNARVYRSLQLLPDSVATKRVYRDYNIISNNAIIIPKFERTFEIDYPNVARNTWYGDDVTNQKVLQYLADLEAKRASLIKETEKLTEELTGIEREAIVKIRENQGVFRKRILKKYQRKCCLCGVTMPELLIASHIKPWCRSDDNEKLSCENGLLLCPNHDKLFDAGYISFDNKGSIVISPLLSTMNQLFTNVKPDMCLKQEYLSEEMKEFLQYHRDHIYKK